MSKDDKEKSGKQNLAKGNNLCKSRSNATKVELDLYYVNTNSFMKFQLNMSKDNKEKSGKRNFSKIKFWPVLCQDKSIYEISSQYVERWQRKLRKTKF